MLGHTGFENKNDEELIELANDDSSLAAELGKRFAALKDSEGVGTDLSVRVWREDGRR